MIYLISGKARSGKNTLANYMKEELEKKKSNQSFAECKLLSNLPANPLRRTGDDTYFIF